MPQILALLIACGVNRWSSVEDCSKISAGDRQDNCWAQTLPELFRTDPERAEKLTREAITDSRVRDYVWLTVTREVAPATRRYCDQIEEPTLAERCRVLVSRPHLHRELSGQPGAGPQGQSP